MYKRFVVLLAFALFVPGCSFLGDVVVPPHPNSAIQSPELICLSTSHMPKAEGLSLYDVGNSALGFVFDQVAHTIEAESKRYKATYSGLTSASSQLDFGINRLEFAAGVLNLHLPVYAALGVVDIG